MFEYLVAAAVVASLLAAFAYIRSMFRGGAKPNRVTWLMWAFAPIIAAVAMVSNGVTWPALPVFMSGFSPLLIFLASFFIKGAYWKLSAFDYGCGALSALALVLWWLTKEPNAAIVFAMFSDALAAVPTVKKTWQAPKTESPWPFITGVFGAFASLAAVALWTFSEYAFPVYLLAINLLVVTVMYRPKVSSTGQKSSDLSQVL
jgi:hypothetical protein